MRGWRADSGTEEEEKEEKTDDLDEGEERKHDSMIQPVFCIDVGLDLGGSGG